jgi:hypothetical protein
MSACAAPLYVRFWHETDFSAIDPCPLLREKRIWRFLGRMSPYDPKRTWPNDQMR